MKQKVMFIFTRTPLHLGAGTSVGAIDQPIQRERHTGFPVIPGSSIKGVLRDLFERNEKTKEAVPILFGQGGADDVFTAGSIAFGDARILAFPVRSAKGSYAMTTSSLALRRFARDARLELDTPEDQKPMMCLAGNNVLIEKGEQKGVVLEEYRFNSVGPFPDAWEKHLLSALDDVVLAGSAGRFVLLSDGDFSHFTATACPVNQHVKIDSETGTAAAGALFNEETVPSEALFYSTLTVMPRGHEQNALFDELSLEQLIQFGGSSTTGLGFCSVKLSK